MNAIKHELMSRDVAKYLYALIHDSESIDGLPVGYFRLQLSKAYGTERLNRIVKTYIRNM